MIYFAGGPVHAGVNGLRPVLDDDPVLLVLQPFDVRILRSVEQPHPIVVGGYRGVLPRVNVAAVSTP